MEPVLGLVLYTRLALNLQRTAFLCLLGPGLKVVCLHYPALKPILELTDSDRRSHIIGLLWASTFGLSLQNLWKGKELTVWKVYVSSWGIHCVLMHYVTLHNFPELSLFKNNWRTLFFILGGIYVTLIHCGKLRGKWLCKLERAIKQTVSTKQFY